MSSISYNKCCGFCSNWDRGTGKRTTTRRCDYYREITCYGNKCNNFQLDRHALTNIQFYLNKTNIKNKEVVGA